MVKLLAVFFQAIHGAEIVPFSPVPADNGVIFGNINPAYRITVSGCRNGARPGDVGFFLPGHHGHNDPVTDVNQ